MHKKIEPTINGDISILDVKQIILFSIKPNAAMILKEKLSLIYCFYDSLEEILPSQDN